MYVDRRARSRSPRAGARPSPGSAGEVGQPSRARLTLPDEPRNLKRRTSSTKLGSSVARLDEPRKVSRGSTDGEDDARVDLFAGLEDDARRSAALHDDPRDRRLGPDLGAQPRARRRRSRWRSRRSRRAGSPRRGRRRRSRPCSGGAARRRCPGERTPRKVPMIPRPTSWPSARRSRTTGRGSRRRTSS